MIQKINFPNFIWINIINASAKEIEELGFRYGFHPLDLADCLSTSQRTKNETHPKYSFLTFLFPVYDRPTREILPAEINIFIGKDYLITVNEGKLEPFDNFFNTLKSGPNFAEKYPDKSPERLLYEILNKLFNYCFPMIDHLIMDCDGIGKAIFSGAEKKMVSEILIIRRNITDFRKIMQVHRNVLKKAVYYFKNNPNFVMKKTDAYFESLVDYSKEIWDTLENLKERIEALQETNESQISFKLSDTMHTLTVISVFIFPLTLIAAIFTIATNGGMPFLNQSHGFWYVIGLMAIFGATMFAVFKKKGWI